MKHSLSKTRLYAIYSGMKQRCYNTESSNYSNYGGKGICICEEWMSENGLQNFIEWSLNNGYNENLTIDRIDSNKGYSPGNCQWITQSANSSRKRTGDVIVKSGLDKAERNIIMGKAGGTAGKNSVNYKISLPAEMVKALGVTQEGKAVTVDYVDGKIVIEKKISHDKGRQ